jgi:hypothetical protein
LDLLPNPEEGKRRRIARPRATAQPFEERGARVEASAGFKGRGSRFEVRGSRFEVRGERRMTNVE